jgi:hypothetical protein
MPTLIQFTQSQHAEVRPYTYGVGSYFDCLYINIYTPGCGATHYQSDCSENLQCPSLMAYSPVCYNSVYDFFEEYFAMLTQA